MIWFGVKNEGKHSWIYQNISYHPYITNLNRPCNFKDVLFNAFLSDDNYHPFVGLCNVIKRENNQIQFTCEFQIHLEQECIPVGCVPSAVVAVSGVSAYGGVHPPWTDRRLWKHYLSATTVADGKYWCDDSRLEVAWDNNLFLSWYPALVMKHSVIDFHYVSFKILLLQVRIYGK